MVEVMARSETATSANGRVSKGEMTVLPVVKRMGTIKSYPMVVYPDTARKWRDTMTFERQRRLQPANIERLAAEMSAGRFVDGTPIYIAVLPDGSKRLLNGNHTLEAINTSGCPQVLVLIYKDVADIDEAGAIYAVLDIHKARTWADSLRAVDEDADTSARRALSGVNMILNGFGYASGDIRPSRPVVINHYKNHYRDAAELYSKAIAGASPVGGAKYVKRAGVVAVALETLRYQPSAAFEFWHRFATNPGLNPGDPEYALLTCLANLKTTAGGNAQRVTCMAVALAWNAAFLGEPRWVLKANYAKEFKLLGTPHDNGVKREEA